MFWFGQFIGSVVAAFFLTRFVMYVFKGVSSPSSRLAYTYAVSTAVGVLAFALGTADGGSPDIVAAAQVVLPAFLIWFLVDLVQVRSGRSLFHGKTLVLLPPAVFALIAGLFLGGMFRDDPEGLPSTLEGRPAPPLVLDQLGEQPPFSGEMLAQGGVKLVNYWASWCAPCRIEHPVLMQIAASGVPVYGINYKDDPEKALAFLSELGNPYLGLGADNSGRNALEWGVYGVPETFVIDGEGTVLLRFAGPVTAEIFDKRIMPAIEAAAAGR